MLPSVIAVVAGGLLVGVSKELPGYGMVGPRVEAAQARGLDGAQERERRHRRARAARRVVAARRGRAAADLLGGDPGRVDAAVDRRADPRVVAGALHHPATCSADVLGGEVDRVVGLVPGEPEADRRQRSRVGAGEGAAVASRRRVGEGVQVGCARGGLRGGAAAVGPGGRADDREEHLDPVRLRGRDRRVIGIPPVGGIGRIAGTGRARRRDRAPGEVQPRDLRVQRAERREGLGREVERVRVVEDPDEQPARGRRRGHGEEHDGRCGRREQGEAPTHRPVCGRAP